MFMMLGVSESPVKEVPVVFALAIVAYGMGRRREKEGEGDR